MTIGRIFRGIELHKEKENRKKQTAELLSQGYSPIEIAGMLNVREQTILNYIRELNSGVENTQKKYSLEENIVSIIVCLVIFGFIALLIYANVFY